MTTLELVRDYADSHSGGHPSHTDGQYAPMTEDYVSRFYSLKSRWEQDTAFSSSITDIVSCPSFQDIMRMGEVAIPLILRELRAAPSLLFLALQGITGQNPVPASSRGDIAAMTNAWLDWASRNPAYAD